MSFVVLDNAGGNNSSILHAQVVHEKGESQFIHQYILFITAQYFEVLRSRGIAADVARQTEDLAILHPSSVLFCPIKI